MVMPAAASATRRHTTTQPTLYFSQTVAPSGTNLSLPIRLNAAGTAINAVNVVVTLPTSQLSYVSLDTSSSYFGAVIPSTPVVEGGTVTFAVASLAAGPTTSDVLVGNLIVAPIATSGNAKVSLSGSIAANAGIEIPLQTTDTTVSLKTNGHGKKPHSLTISDITVSDVTVSGGKISWKTSDPTTSTLSYGLTDSYGLTATSDELSTDHSATLDNPVTAKTVVHYKISAVDADTNQVSTGDQTFTTKGYELHLKVVDSQGKPLVGVTVKTSEGQSAVTDASGIAVLSDLGAGTQSVSVNGAAPQLVSVKSTTFENAATPQDFQLVANRTTSGMTYASYLLLFILLVAIGVIAWQKRIPRTTV
jgi:hypothetical protein